jgi:homoserine acetyltransferase
MGELRLESGESIRDFCLSYVTHGTLNAGRSNAVLMASVVALIPLARTPAWSTGITEMLRIDANDWLYQSWAYDAHNVGTTPGFNGD